MRKSNSPPNPNSDDHLPLNCKKDSHESPNVNESEKESELKINKITTNTPSLHLNGHLSSQTSLISGQSSLINNSDLNQDSQGNSTVDMMKLNKTQMLVIKYSSELDNFKEIKEESEEKES